MNTQGRFLLAMLLPALVFAAQAQGQAAFTAKQANLRAGPGPEYPLVAVLPAGDPVAIQGCLAGYTWCDVLAGPGRGWVYAGNINAAFQNDTVLVLSHGAAMGVPVLAFVLDDYWSLHYQDRPWYGQRQRRILRPAPAPPNPPPNPPPPAGVPGADGPRPHPPVPIGPRPAQPQPPRSVVPKPQPSRTSGDLGPQRRQATSAAAT
ncbi:MAG: SH3 domain-containing protein [Ramlibacter sp.]|nr:SH3 domain-containing protein [Ramlibacter sp.]